MTESASASMRVFVGRARLAVLVMSLASLASLASLVSIGCTRVAPDATPEGAVRLWLDKMEASTQDPRATREAYELLGPAARANLAERAERAAKVQGRRVDPYEMLAEGRFGLKFRPKTMTTRIDASNPEAAVVEVIGDSPLTEHALVHCAHVAARSSAAPSAADPSGGAKAGGGGGWRVEPELPDVMSLPKRGPEAPL